MHERWETLETSQHPEQESYKPLASTSNRVKAKACIRRGDITKNIAKEMYYLASASRAHRGISYFKCAG